MPKNNLNHHLKNRKSPIRLRSSFLWHKSTVALFGGSFNPAHAGHKHIALMALKTLKIDFVWWMVSPGNPLKSSSMMADFDRRFQSAQTQAKTHPRMIVSDIENQMGTRYTVASLRKLTRYFPRTRFVWIMGEDNLTSIHKWQKWKSIFNMMDVVIFNRNSTSKLPHKASFYALNQLKNKRIPAYSLRYRLPSNKKHNKRWGFVFTHRHDISSTALRAKGEWRV